MADKPLRVLVCGGRNYTERARVYDLLSRINDKHGIAIVIHGGASGADYFADEWAALLNIARHRFPAQWDKHGKAAGPIRNQAMLDKGRPDIVLAFPGGSGTANMIEKATNAGIKVMRVSNDGDAQ